ncbi:MAG: hypothetical protein HY322_05100 [Betaproteobacteria bacterium]|nr:hypothetical protein [Betaproteobacteria bacterium]
MRIFLGSNFGHGAAVAVISEEGELLYAVEEGVLIGEKDTAQFPSRALSLVASSVDGEIVAWTEGWHPQRRLWHKGILRTLKYGMYDTSYFRHGLLREWKRYLEGRKGFANWGKRLVFPNAIGHHMAHAYSLLPAGLPPNSLVLISDTTAERASISSYYFSGEKMTLIATSLFPHSIGSVFHQLAYHLGFRKRTGPGKLMALSAYGEPRFLDYLTRIGAIRNGVFRIVLETYPAWMRDGGWLKFAESAPAELRSSILEARDSPNKGLDLAASAQAWFTEMTWECVKQSLEIARKRLGVTVAHLGLAGGAALNCQANGEFLVRLPAVELDTLTVSPWSDDSGTAVGAAVSTLAQQGLIARIRPCLPFIGPPLTVSAGAVSDDHVRASVRCLTVGQVIALVSGRLEFGPRALGGRCLLADPRYEESRLRLNRMKARPEFMPIAPVVLEEDYDQYFEGIGSRHMAWTVPAKEWAKQRIPAAVHISGRSRVQVLRKGEAPLLERVLLKFRDETGCGALLLTSLNGEGEPVPPCFERAKSVARGLGATGLISDFR